MKFNLAGNKIRIILMFLCKIVITASLLACMFVVIAGEYAAFKKRIDDYQLRRKVSGGGNSIELKANMKSLNQALPDSFDYIVAFSDNPEEPDSQKLKDYKSYYELVATLVDDHPDAQGMLGYLYYHSGDKNKALDSYKKAIEMGSNYFWYFYNLGLIHYEQNNFSESQKYLRLASKKEISTVLRVVFTSKIYTQIISSVDSVEQKLLLNYWKALKNCYKLLVDMYLRSDATSEIFSACIEAINLNFDDNGYFSYHGGIAAYKLKKYQMAIGLMQMSIKKNDEHANAYYYIGESLKALGRETEAESFLKQGVALYKQKGEMKIMNDFDIQLKIF